MGLEPNPSGPTRASVLSSYTISAKARGFALRAFSLLTYLLLSWLSQVGVAQLPDVLICTVTTLILRPLLITIRRRSPCRSNRWCRGQDSNLRHIVPILTLLLVGLYASHFYTIALPTELPLHIPLIGSLHSGLNLQFARTSPHPRLRNLLQQTVLIL